MGQLEIKEQKTVKTTIDYFPCVKCASDDIEFNDCGYSSFNVAWGKCNNCNHRIEIKSCAWNIQKKEIIEVWNKSNNPELLREKYQNKIDELQKLIDLLPT